jgi:hypothetical protein
MGLAFVCAAAVLRAGDSLSNDTTTPVATYAPVMVGGLLPYTLFSGGRLRNYFVRIPCELCKATAHVAARYNVLQHRSAAMAGARVPVVFALHCHGCDATSVRPLNRGMVRRMACARRIAAFGCGV